MHQVGGRGGDPALAVLLPMVALSGLLSAAFGLTLGSNIQPRFAGCSSR